MPTQPVLGTRTTFQDEIHVEAPAHTVFPLLCPVREYDWIDGWTCVMIHSASGVAEDGCIFQTAFRGEGQMTWVVSRYEPAERIAFTCFLHPHVVMRLSIVLDAAGEGVTRTRWTREFTALDTEGESVLASVWNATAHREMMARLAASLTHYVRTGVRLPAGAPVAERTA